MKLAILQMADQAPAESTAIMLRAAGYDVYLPDDRLRYILRGIGCDTVLSPADLARGMGYEMPNIPEIGPEAMDRCDLYCDVKAHRSYPKIVRRWPRLTGKVLWTRINGGQPEHVVKRGADGTVLEDHGDEVNPPCPVLTPNLWYAEPGPWRPRAYACWPPFHRWGQYYRLLPGTAVCHQSPPLCLVHNARGWGYQAMLEPVAALGVRVYGQGSPDGLVQHREVAGLLASALAYVHLKSNDSPGYALYEAMAAGCPCIVSRRLIWRCKMGELFTPGETCLVFDRETHEGLTPEDVVNCTAEIKEHLWYLGDPENNRRIGEAGRERLKGLMWSAERAADVDGLKEWLGRMYP